MTYEAQEEGHGQPVELYQFRRGVTKSYLYTSHDVPITFGSLVYQPIQIKAGKIEQNSEIERADLPITIQRDAEILDNFIAFPRTEVITITVFRQHLNDGDAEFITAWKGRVLTVNFKRDTGVLICEPIFTSLKRPGLVRTYQAQCPHALYGGECQVVDQLYKIQGTVTGIIANTIQATAWAAFDDNYFNGGYVVFDNAEFRSITDSLGTGILTLTANIPDLSGGGLVMAYPGCKHNLDDCLNKFNNVINYGGFPYIPKVNPFNGTMIY